MIASEAIVVAEIACTADGGCNVCAGSQIEVLMAIFPEHAETFRQVYLHEFDYIDKDWPS